MNAVIVTGLSGAGKTQASICLEDLGYYCIDNMPPVLMKNFIELTSAKGGIERVAFVADIRGGAFFKDLKDGLRMLRKEGIEYKILFLEAEDEVLIRRFNETRRAHPLGGSVREGIKNERAALKEIREMADYIVDTSGMKSAGLRRELAAIFTNAAGRRKFTVNVESFGYKNGIPLEADMVFDVRFIPNPFYVASLKKLTGNNLKVREYVMRHPESGKFIADVSALIQALLPCFEREGKYHLNVAFGCTGGHHRSVVMANEFAEAFRESGHTVTLVHRDL